MGKRPRIKRIEDKPMIVVGENPDILCWFDGACAPVNPGGFMGWGSIIKYQDKVNNYFDGYKESPENSNNCSEYLALLKILTELDGEINKKIIIYGDSNMVVNQMNGRWKIKSGLYLKYAISAKQQIEKLRKKNIIILQWIPREQNSEADSLSNEGIFKVAGRYIEFDKYYWRNKNNNSCQSKSAEVTLKIIYD